MMKLLDACRSTLQDVGDGIARWELWSYLGWRDVKRQYNRSILGPLWLTLSMSVMILGLGALYSQILQVEVGNYLPRLAIGLIIWGFISGLVIGACQIFISAGASLRQVRLPLSFFVLKFVWSQAIIFGHNIIIYFGVIAIFNINPGLSSLLVMPALFLIMLSGFFVSLLLGPLCARFRDIPMIVGSMIQIAFFMTPIIWDAAALPEKAYFLSLNPFYYYLEIFREPLLGGTATPTDWIVAVTMTALLGLTSIIFFGRYRKRIAYWS